MLIYTGVKKSHTEKKIKLKLMLKLFHIKEKNSLEYGLKFVQKTECNNLY